MSLNVEECSEYREESVDRKFFLDVIEHLLLAASHSSGELRTYFPAPDERLSSNLPQFISSRSKLGDDRSFFCATRDYLKVKSRFKFIKRHFNKISDIYL